MRFAFIKKILFILFFVLIIPQPVSAFDPFTIKLKFWQPPRATVTPTPTITPIPEPTDIPLPTLTYPPTTGIPTDSIAKVEQMVYSIRANCTEDGIAGRVDTTNFFCVESIIPPLPQTVIDVLHISTFNNTYLQCVGFVKGADLIASGSTFSEVTNPKSYIDNPPVGYRYIINNNDLTNLQSGDLVLWDWYNNGHIAYVTRVDTGADAFTVAEGNWDGYGVVQMRTDYLDQVYLRGWLRKI